MQKHDFFEELGRQRLVELWEAAIGAPAAPAEQTATAIQFFDKPPGADKDTPIHQDGGFTVPHITNGCTELAQVTLLLDDMDADNGALRFVHGSHREGLRPHGEGVVSFSKAMAGMEEADLAREVPMVAKRGDVLVHHCLTVRCSRHHSSLRKCASASVCFPRPAPAPAPAPSPSRPSASPAAASRPCALRCTEPASTPPAPAADARSATASNL